MAAMVPHVRWGAREVSWTWVPATAEEVATIVRPVMAELVGTLGFTFVAGSAIVDRITDGGLGLLGIAVATAIAYAVIVSMMYPVSGGHINPAVTLAHMGTARIPPSVGLLYMGAQIGGAILGGLLLQFIYRDFLTEAAKAATLIFSEEYGNGWPALWTGAFLEAILTFVLVLAYFGTLVDPRGNKALGGFAVGLVVLFGMLVAFPLTGAAMNVARLFGTATAASHWTHFGMYWLGLAGGLLAGLMYEYFFAAREREA